MAQTAASAMIAAALLVAAIPTPSYSQAALGKGQTGTQGTSGKCNAPGQIKKGASCNEASSGAASGSGSAQSTTDTGSTTAGTGSTTAGTGSTTAGGTQTTGSYGGGTESPGSAQGSTDTGSTAAGGIADTGSYAVGAASSGAPRGYYNEQGYGYGPGAGGYYGQVDNYSSEYAPEGGMYYPQTSWSSYRRPIWNYSPRASWSSYRRPIWSYYPQSGWSFYRRPIWNYYPKSSWRRVVGWRRGLGWRADWRGRWDWRRRAAIAGAATAVAYNDEPSDYEYGDYRYADYYGRGAYSAASNYNYAASPIYNNGDTNYRYGNYYDRYGNYYSGSPPGGGVAALGTAGAPAVRTATVLNHRGHRHGYKTASAGWTRAYLHQRRPRETGQETGSEQR